MNGPSHLLRRSPTFNGRPMDTSPEALGELRSSIQIIGQPAELRQRMQEDGYLFLPGLLRSGEVLEARQAVLEKLNALGYLAPGRPIEAALPKAGCKLSFMAELAKDNPALDRVLYQGPLLEFFGNFLGDSVLHFDYTWFRPFTPGPDSIVAPHYDIVYMGRGTKNLYSTWTPIGDLPVEEGGLMILEGSHRQREVINTYGRLDVDSYCTNYPDAGDIASGRKTAWQDWLKGGNYSNDGIGVREQLGGRWLTADFKAGDALVFSMFTMHIMKDNQTDHIRFSSDSRYQLASEPADERWIGANPIGHGSLGKRGMIC